MLTLNGLSEIPKLPVDTIIDVRAPAEFAEDHLPGAINLPVLSDAERAEVGTIYKQDSPFRARKVGAALVAKNAAKHLEGALADKPGGWQPLVYCWRGGQRSGSFASILAQIGWRVEVLDGGYRSYRRLVVKALYDEPWTHPLLVLDGNTGSGKTAVLERLAHMGAQVIDLEGLARHRGSILGERPGGQPSQKAFETGLAMAAAAFDPAQVTVVEAESSKVGDLILPPGLWAALRTAPRVVIEAPLAARAAYLAGAYADVALEPERVSELLGKLIPFHGRAQVGEWLALAEAGENVALAGALAETHYDPRYRNSRDRWQGEVRGVLRAHSLEPAGLDQLAQQVLDMVSDR